MNTSALPSLSDNALLIGRIWQPNTGPVLVAVTPDQVLDLSRLALLRLMKSTGEAPVIDEQRLALSGQMILRRLIDNWGSLPAVKAAFDEQLAAGGHDKRGQDTFGTLLSIASLIVGERFDDLEVPLGDDLSPWGELLKAENVSTVKTSLVIRCAKDEPGVPFDVLEARLARSA